MSVFASVARNISDSRSKRNIGIAAVGAGTVLAPQESEASVAKLAARGMGLVPNIDPEDTRVGEYFLRQGDDTKSIGSLKTDYAIESGFDEGYMSSLDTEIAPGFRRQGLAGEMYDAAEEISGNKLVPSTHLSMDGGYMWNARDPKLLEQVHEKMGPENYQRIEDILYPDGRPHPNAVKLRGFDRKYAAPAATAVGVGAMSQSNRTLAGTHPGDNADMSGLTLIPEMVSTVINDVYKYGKQAVTGKQDDGRLMETPESVGDAVAIKDAVSKVADWGLNYRGVMGGTSAMDIITGAMDAYTGTVRPALISALGDAGTKRLEATGMLASMLLPAKNAKGALDIPEVDRDTKLLQRVGDPKSVNSLNVEFEEGPALLDNPMVKAEDIVNRPYVAGMSDTSRGALETLKSISGSEYNVLMEGGQDYMRQLRNANKGALWASDAGAITGMMNNAKGAMKLPGAKGSPLFFPYQMGGKSTDFATMTTDIMVPYAQRNMSKKDKKLVDKRIRDGAGNMLNDFTPQPDWPGVDSPKAMDWLKQAGTGRKAVVKALDEFRGEGSLNASQARAMIVDPAQINPRVANLQNVGQFDMSRNPMPGQHSTYNTDIMGNHLGRFGDGMNLLTDLNPVIRTSGKDFKQEMISRGHNLEAEKLPAPVGKTMMPGLVGVLDERTVEELVKKGFVSP